MIWITTGSNVRLSGLRVGGSPLDPLGHDAGRQFQASYDGMWPRALFVYETLCQQPELCHQPGRRPPSQSHPHLRGSPLPATDWNSRSDWPNASHPAQTSGWCVGPSDRGAHVAQDFRPGLGEPRGQLWGAGPIDRLGGPSTCSRWSSWSCRRRRSSRLTSSSTGPSSFWHFKFGYNTRYSHRAFGHCLLECVKNSPVFLFRGFSALVESPHTGNLHQHVMRSSIHIFTGMFCRAEWSQVTHTLSDATLVTFMKGSSERSFVQRGEGSRDALWSPSLCIQLSCDSGFSYGEVSITWHVEVSSLLSSCRVTLQCIRCGSPQVSSSDCADSWTACTVGKEYTNALCADIIQGVCRYHQVLNRDFFRLSGGVMSCKCNLNWNFWYSSWWWEVCKCNLYFRLKWVILLSFGRVARGVTDLWPTVHYSDSLQHFRDTLCARFVR